MIIDVTGTILIPGNGMKDCPGNGCHPGVECCCDECNYMMCCVDERWPACCCICSDPDCPRKE